MIAHFKGTGTCEVDIFVRYSYFCIIMFKVAKLTNRLRDKQRRFGSFFKSNAYIFGQIKSHKN